MLRIIQNSHADRAKSYYTSGGDYYLDGQELTGVWRGTGAQRLGLAGEIQRADWDALCEGRAPRTDAKLLQRLKENRTVGYDFNFHVPKSVSLLYAATEDERLLDAFRESVDETMRDIEGEAQTRVRKGGRNEDRVTGNLIWGEFIHKTARPVDGIPDPHLHAHCFVFNVTYDDGEHAWKAGQFRDLKRDAPYFEALFHARLSHRLAELGLPIERTRKGWELGGLPPSLLQKFSRRTALIEEQAREQGIDDPKAKDKLGAKTRSRKAKDLAMPELRAEWRGRMSSPEAAALDRLQSMLGGDAQPPEGDAATKAVDYAIRHEFERRSVVPERQVLATALKRSVGRARPEEVMARCGAADLIRGEQSGRAMVTSRNVLAEEREIVAFARDGRGSCRPLAPGDYPIKRDWLNESQRQAVRHLLQSRDRVISLAGSAGVGKTSLMQEAVEAIEAHGTKVIACAPSAAASRGVLRDEGFHEADTLARLLVDEKMQENARGQLIWVDEASLVGTRTLRDLFRLADRVEARVLLTGDRFQHGSVNRGASLRLLEEEAGIVPATVKEIQRQHGEYKEAVKALSAGDVAQGFRRLDRMGWIRELPEEDRYQALAADYAAAVARGESSLVVAPTHFEGNKCTHEIRRQLKEQGKLADAEREMTALVNAQLTEAEKTDPVNYHAGDVVQFVQNAKGFAKGRRLTVGKDAPPLPQADRFAVFRRSTLRIAPGDLIRITHGGRTLDGRHRLDTGSVFTVKDFDRQGNVVLANGWTIGRDFGHWTHGYVVTSHASQSRTVERVIIAQSADSLAASSKEQLYVSVSRGRRQATIYTDHKEALLDAVSQSDDRMTATELAGQQRSREVVALHRRTAALAPEREAEHSRELVYER